MKRTLIIVAGLTLGISSFAQQTPLSESYFLDKYSFSPAYAGNFNPKYIFIGYRSDWTGIKGGPKTFRLTFNDRVMKNSGYGINFIYDKAGIFNQIYLLGTYSYNLKVNEENSVLFGLSAGFYRNTLNMLDYYNDPEYDIDPALIGKDINSKIKFMTNASVVWLWKSFEAGFMFSNISVGNAHYSNTEIIYRPLANFQGHISYLFSLAKDWDLVPLAIIRGGKSIKSQFEIASQVLYSKKVWGSIVFRDPGVWGAGIGAEVTRGLKISYNFNFASNVTMSAFNSHEITLGANIFQMAKKD